MGNAQYRITPIDVAVVVVIYLLLQAIRAAMVVVLYPALAYLGYGITVKEAIFLG